MKRSTTMTTAALLTGLTLFVTACTGGAGGSEKKKDGSSSASSGGSGSGSGADADNALKMRKCLRDNGVDAPDPKAGEDPRGMTVGADADQEVLKKAMEKCGMQAPGSGSGPTQAEKDKALHRAKCMRDNGFDMPDPEFNGNAMTGTSIPEGADPQKFMDQLNKCSADQ
ncbi:hypothetical protein [Streptomyces sp. NBC_00454]|uniref:hypothetical protein n=1 Tax=Streptomyces sp. NBC_00454 TaxID=2975747 RepID=UPI0030DF891C